MLYEVKCIMVDAIGSCYRHFEQHSCQSTCNLCVKYVGLLVQNIHLQMYGSTQFINCSSGVERFSQRWGSINSNLHKKHPVSCLSVVT